MQHSIHNLFLTQNIIWLGHLPYSLEVAPKGCLPKSNPPQKDKDWLSLKKFERLCLRLGEQIQVRSLKCNVNKSSIFGSSAWTSRGLLHCVQDPLWCRNSDLFKKEESHHCFFSHPYVTRCLDKDLRFGHKHHRVTATQHTCSEGELQTFQLKGRAQWVLTCHLYKITDLQHSSGGNGLKLVPKDNLKFWRIINLDLDKARFKSQLHLLARMRPWSSHLGNRYNYIYLGRVL